MIDCTVWWTMCAPALVYTLMYFLSSSPVMLQSRWAPPPSSQPCAPRHKSPHPWWTVGHPPQSVGQCQGMCTFMAGWIHEPAQFLDPHLSCTYVITIAQSQRIGILEVGSNSKVIEWCTLGVCSACAQHAKDRKWQTLLSSNISCSACVLF